MTQSQVPPLDEIAEFYHGYLARVPAGDIQQFLHDQTDRVRATLDDIPDSFASHRYAEGKWSIRQLVGHISDTERVFSFRAFWFARGLEGPLPGFDQDVAVKYADDDRRDFGGLIREFTEVRASTLDLFDSLPEEAWTRGGIASDQHVTVRALAWVIAGHVEHHLAILHERYLVRGR
jgi:uncharacterized damage-inducible protein DinB